MRDASVSAQHATASIDDIARLAGFRAQLLNERRIRALRHEAEVLTIRLFGYRRRELAREPAGLVLQQSTERKAQEIEFLARRAIKEIALIARGIAGAVQFRPVRSDYSANVMSRRQRARAELARSHQKIAELDAFIAANARDRCLAPAIGVCEILDHRGTESGLVVENVMWNPEARCNARRIVHILAGAARALFA